MLASQTIMMRVPDKVKAAALDVQVSSATKTNDSLGGFVLVSKQWVEALKSNVYIYKHVKSGAHLIYLENDSKDKMMCINFRTPAKDNTGVNHVIEHSVLCGSKNYPVNEVVNQMSKQSLSTYLNAMTTDDKTMYPVASENDKDFQNLMGVYLDAVFYPNLLSNKKIFEQEGIRYELNSPSDELKYNGVVYNEMKGVYSSPDAILSRAIKQSLFPDTSYKYESGGLPDEMSKLTYDNVVKTYNKNYTPSNSYFYLYGKMDIDKTLKFIGDKYLNNFDKKDVDTNIELQKPFTKSVEKTAEYSIPKGTSTQNKTYLTLNYVIDKNTNKELVEAFSYLQVLLGGIPSSPITKALRDNGFGDNTSVSFDFSGVQPVLTIEAANVNENQKEQFKEVVNQTLENIVQNGFNSELLSSISKVVDLSQRMLKGNYALNYDDLIMRSWMNGGDPTAYLNMASDMSDIESKAKSGYFQDLIKKYLLENNHSSLLVLKSSPGLQDKKDAELKEKLAKYKASLSKEQVDDLVQNTQEFEKWQETPPTQEQLNSLPSLSLKDINTNVKQYTTIENNEQGIKVLEHPMFTNGVDYTTLYFDTTRVPQDKLGYIYLLSSVLGNIGTKNYTEGQLAEQELINTGGISFSPRNFVNHSNNNIYSPKMVVSLVGLNQNSAKYFDLLNEIIFNSNFSDKARLKAIIDDLKMSVEQNLAYDGNDLAIEKTLSYMSKSGMYNDYANEKLYSFLCDLDANFDKKSNEIVSNLQQVRDLIFNKNDMIASYTGDKANYNNFVNSLDGFSKNLQYPSAETNTYNFDNSKTNEGLIIPSNVQYVVKGGDIDKAGSTENGKFLVLQNILQSQYLWDNIRVKGGAYGAYMNTLNGDVRIPQNFLCNIF
jgi:Zn-dependent M16 (insulinase) family peptidase